MRVVWHLMGLFCLVLAGAASPSAAWAVQIEPGSRPLFTQTGGAIAMVSPEGRLTLTPKGERWWVTGPDGQAHLADRTRVEALRSRLAGLRSTRPLGRFGAPREGAFDDPVTIRWGDQQVQYGVLSRVPGLVYLRFGNGDIHLAPPPFEMPDPASLVDRRLFPDGLPEVDSINVTGAGHLLHVTKKFGVWRLTVPDPSNANGPLIDAWLDRISGLTGDPVSPPENGREPVKLVLSSSQGPSITLTAWPNGPVALDGGVYRVDWPDLIPQRFDWMEKVFLRVEKDGITGVNVLQAEESHRFSRGEKHLWRERTSGRAYKTWVKNLFKLLNPLTAIGLYDGDDTTLGEPQVEVQLWQGTDIYATVELWMSDDGRWWARGGETVYIYEIDGALPAHLARLF